MLVVRLGMEIGVSPDCRSPEKMKDGISMFCCQNDGAARRSQFAVKGDCLGPTPEHWGLFRLSGYP